MKRLITGANGRVGSALWAYFLQRGDEVIPVTRADVDLTNLPALRAFLLEKNFDCLINPAAMSAPDQCEQEPELAQRINADAPAVMAEIAQLLVGEGLERGGVKNLPPVGEGAVDGVLAHQGLAGAGGSAHHHRVALVEGVDLPVDRHRPRRVEQEDEVQRPAGQAGSGAEGHERLPCVEFGAR